MKKIIAGLLAASAATMMLSACSKAPAEESTTAATTTEATTKQPTAALSEYLVGGEFSGRYFNVATGEYLDANEIRYTVTFEGGTGGHGYAYSYTTELEGEQIGSGSDIELTSSSAQIIISSEEVYESGHVVLTVYDQNGSELITDECDVVKTPPESRADITGFHVDPGEPGGHYRISC